MAMTADGGRVLVLAEHSGLAQALVRKLAAAGVGGETVAPGSDSELTQVLADGDWSAVAVVSRDDVLALRLTLLCAHVRDDLPLWVTMFDTTIVHQLRQTVPEVNIVSPAELVAGDLADHCCELMSAARPRWRYGVRVVDDALRLLVAAGAGLVLALAVQTALSMAALHEAFIDALYFSTRAVATVAESPRAAAGPAWFKLATTAVTISALVLVAIFTAALVRRLSERRLTTLLGRRSAPGHGHVLIVGLGQVGFRLAQALRGRGFAVLVVERSEEAPAIGWAHRAGIPVHIGPGDDRGVLELLGVRRCAVVAAVTSNDLANVSVGLAASDIVPGVPLVLRLGDGDVAVETESLLHLGSVCDAHELAAATLARELSRPQAD
ncbi:MAG: NAD-binding protein [Solirubrobacterales bacterium]|nr:NAD-binding protein [Solirubrobacterales bacterium]